MSREQTLGSDLCDHFFSDATKAVEVSRPRRCLFSRGESFQKKNLLECYHQRLPVLCMYARRPISVFSRLEQLFLLGGSLVIQMSFQLRNFFSYILIYRIAIFEP
jgi:hypothetical protein